MNYLCMLYVFSIGLCNALISRVQYVSPTLSDNSIIINLKLETGNKFEWHSHKQFSHPPPPERNTDKHGVHFNTPQGLNFTLFNLFKEDNNPLELALQSRKTAIFVHYIFKHTSTYIYLALKYIILCTYIIWL